MNQTNNYCTIYLIRHGQTEWNVGRLIQGQKDSPLTKNGLEQAKIAAKELSRIKFTHVFSSDLLRAQRTAQIIANEHQLVVQTNKLIRERAFGKYEGKKGYLYQKELRKLIKQKEKLSQEEKFKFRISDDIETDEEIVTRLILFLREAALAYTSQNIAVVSHGGIMVNFLDHLGFLEQNRYYINNLAYVVIQSDGIDFFLRDTNGIEEKNR